MKKSVLVAALTMCLMTSGIASASFFSNLGSKISSSAKSVEHKIKPPKAPKTLTTQKVKDQEMAISRKIRQLQILLAAMVALSIWVK